MWDKGEDALHCAVFCVLGDLHNDKFSIASRLITHIGLLLSVFLHMVFEVERLCGRFCTILVGTEEPQSQPHGSGSPHLTSLVEVVFGLKIKLKSSPGVDFGS